MKKGDPNAQGGAGQTQGNRMKGIEEKPENQTKSTIHILRSEKEEFLEEKENES